MTEGRIVKHVCPNCGDVADSADGFWCTLRPKWERVYATHYCSSFQIGVKR